MLLEIKTQRLNVEWQENLGLIIYEQECIGGITLEALLVDIYYVRHIEIFSAYQKQGFASEIITFLLSKGTLVGYSYTQSIPFWLKCGAELFTEQSYRNQYNERLTPFRICKKEYKL